MIDRRFASGNSNLLLTILRTRLTQARSDRHRGETAATIARRIHHRGQMQTLKSFHFRH